MDGLQPLAVLLRGDGILVVDKPAGLPVQAGRRGGPSVEALLAAAGRNRRAPRAVHRLDQDTSGCLLLAERAAAHRALSAAFAARRVLKLYFAVVAPEPASDGGVVAAALAKRSSPGAGWWMELSDAGQEARTRWRVLARSGASALVAFRPETGRTHQLRVHATCLAPGAAILGDPVYGRAEAGGLMLHAGGLAFGWKGALLVARAPVPTRFPSWARQAAKDQLVDFGGSSEAIIAEAIRSGSGL